MRIIPRSIHGFLDYLTGLFLIGLPWFFNLPPGLGSQIPVLMGVATILYSVLTDYELGLIHLLPFKAHLAIDFLSALLFLAAPYLLHFGNDVAPVYYSIGIFELFAAVMSDTRAKGPVPPSLDHARPR